jgi:hypothetical protein
MKRSIKSQIGWLNCEIADLSRWIRNGWIDDDKVKGIEEKIAHAKMKLNQLKQSREYRNLP